MDKLIELTLPFVSVERIQAERRRAELTRFRFARQRYRDGGQVWDYVPGNLEVPTDTSSRRLKFPNGFFDAPPTGDLIIRMEGAWLTGGPNHRIPHKIFKTKLRPRPKANKLDILIFARPGELVNTVITLTFAVDFLKIPMKIEDSEGVELKLFE